MNILTLDKPRPIRTSSRLDVVHGICQGLPSDILSIYIIILMDNIDYTHDTLFCYNVKKIGGFFVVVPLHIYTAVSV